MADAVKPEAGGEEPNVEKSEDLSTLMASESSSKDAATSDETDNDLEDSSSGHVSFGTVHVHKHRMTLGSNPSATGIPVELTWDQHESEELAVDEFEAQAGENKDVHVIPLKERLEIAEARHSWDSITRVKKEVNDIQESRVESMQDDDRQLKRRHSLKKKLLPWNWFSR